MTREEFEKRLSPETPVPTATQWEVINHVYTFHPSISDAKGKEQIVCLYETAGFRVIADMLPTSKAAEDLDGQIDVKQKELNELKEKRQKFCAAEGEYM